MYNFLQEAAGLLTSKDEQLIKFMQEDDEQIEECECWNVEENKEEEEEKYSYIWDISLPELTFWVHEDDQDNWEDLSPNDFNTVTDYLAEIEGCIQIDFPNFVYKLSFEELPFLEVTHNPNGTVTLSIDKEYLIDYLNEEC